MPSADTNQRIRLSGIIIAMYSPQEGPPARMYMLVADKDGVAGVTVWGDTVHQLMDSSDAIGQAINIPGCSLSLYKGKRSLNVPRNHTVLFPTISPHLDWWVSKLEAEPLTTQQVLALPDHSIANLFAVCAGIRREEKMQCTHHACHDSCSMNRAETKVCNYIFTQVIVTLPQQMAQ
jgi:hypothetical protein